jgi:hypothetical protein
MVGAVLVADDRDGRDLAEREHAPLVVGLGQFGVEAFQHHLAHAGRLTQPDRCRHDQDVGVHQLGTDSGPFVAVALVGGDTELHLVVHDADHLAVDVVIGERGEHLPTQQFCARRRRPGLERAAQHQGAEGCHSDVSCPVRQCDLPAWYPMILRANHRQP